MGRYFVRVEDLSATPQDDRSSQGYCAEEALAPTVVAVVRALLVSWPEDERPVAVSVELQWGPIKRGRLWTVRRACTLESLPSAVQAMADELSLASNSPRPDPQGDVTKGLKELLDVATTLLGDEKAGGIAPILEALASGDESALESLMASLLQSNNKPGEL